VKEFLVGNGITKVCPVWS